MPLTVFTTLLAAWPRATPGPLLLVILVSWGIAFGAGAGFVFSGRA